MQMIMVSRIELCRESNREGLRGMYTTVLDGFKGEIACTLRVSLTPDCNSDCKHRSRHQPPCRAGHGRICHQGALLPEKLVDFDWPVHWQEHQVLIQI